MEYRYPIKRNEAIHDSDAYGGVAPHMRMAAVGSADDAAQPEAVDSWNGEPEENKQPAEEQTLAPDLMESVKRYIRNIDVSRL